MIFLEPQELKSRGSSSQDGYDEFQSTNLLIKTVNKNVAIKKKTFWLPMGRYGMSPV